MKGLLRGLRYISQIFDEKEPEMEIGYPTDVKHVAHIGWDGPSASKPSWMNDFQSAPEISNGTSNSMEEVKSRSVLSLSSDANQGEKQKRRSRRQTNALGSPLNSPNRKSSDGSKHSRRQTTTGIESPLNSPPKNSRRNRSSNTSMDSPSRDSGSARGTRRLQTSDLGVESPVRDQPSIPKHTRGRKTKEPSRFKDKNSSQDMLPSSDRGPEGSESVQVQGTKSYASHLTSVLELYEEEDKV
ncbi:CRIB domain-containing protein RIC5 isoform X2 [Ricinus communis]|uniref:CRIB domain-containing protein RIC5 isoform X2 n=1 Tax=Ricinus communis TaxID=3988 RepID=UPI00077293E3|nr:CRIB domain-containing protein RIC5 isoform X2 [Ricinus communis]|eukprot:XP_002528827.2 CRIB domain-containing protein RIC5 [Ricinus communis]